MTDMTFADVAAYGSERWCAATLGKSLDWLRKHRAALEQDGFPKVDGLIGLTIKADVENWIAKRQRIVNHSGVHHDHHEKPTGVRYEHL